MNSNITLNFGTAMLLIFMVVVFVSVMFKENIFELIIPEAVEITESQKSSQTIANAILELEKLSFDVTILKSDFLTTTSQLPSFPTDAKTLSNFGKINPFLGGFVVNSTPAQGDAAGATVGGLIFSNQRSINDGQALTPVSTNNNNQQRGNRNPVRSPGTR